LAGNDPGGFLFRNLPSDSLPGSVRRVQRQALIPLLIAGQNWQEQGKGIRIPQGVSLGAVGDDMLLHTTGQALAGECKDLGIHLLLTPSLNEFYDRKNRNYLGSRTLRLNEGLGRGGLIGCPSPIEAYFPLEKDSLRLDSLMGPYRKMAQSGIPALQVSGKIIRDIHMNSSRQEIVRNWLYEYTGYRGLLLAEVLPDSTLPADEQTARMIKAGIDLFITPRAQADDVYYTLLRWVERGWLPEEQLDEQVRKALRAKHWAGAARDFRVAHATQAPVLRRKDYLLLNRQLAEATLTIARDSASYLPFYGLGAHEFGVVTVGDPMPAFTTDLNFYADLPLVHVQADSQRATPPLPDSLARFHPLIVGINDVRLDPEIDAAFLRSIERLGKRTEVVVVNFGELENLRLIPRFPTLVQAYNNDTITQSLAAQLLFGGIGARGKLPVALGPTLPYGAGDWTRPWRLALTMPEEAGLSGQALRRIDTLAQMAIRAGATPGCQILVAKSGKVVYHKAFGYQTYSREQAVLPTDLYDIASVTKIAATTLATMKLYDEGKLNLDDPLSRFFQRRPSAGGPVWVSDTLMIPDQYSGGSFYDPNAGDEYYDTIPCGDSLMVIRRALLDPGQQPPVFDIRLSELLTHRSGLPAGFATYQFARPTRRLPAWYRSSYEEAFAIPVAERMFLRNDYMQALWNEILYMPVNQAKPYLYSDANMVLLQQVIDTLNQEPMDRYLTRVFYNDLGMRRTCFNPLNTFPAERIAPTENDREWRDQVLRGYVHDPTAALMGGVAGNAGLFSTASDLAHLCQMWLNKGSYGGVQFLKPETVDLFTRRREGHRGYGFDMPPLEGPYLIGESASRNSYGHTGFTGTCVWVDPDQELVYIFLSNRVSPDAGNWRLNNMRIREQIHDAIYRALSLGSQRDTELWVAAR
ncbi:MAG: hypothetical protein EAZ89_04555, partial [Bacteroidetes bacterium]